MAMKHLYRIYPKRTIRGIRPQEIMEPTILENLNRQEFLKCFNGGELYAIVNDEEVHIKECNYDKAEALFVEKETLVDPEITFVPPNIDQYITPVMNDHINKNMRSISDEIIDKTLEQATAVVETQDAVSVTTLDDASTDTTAAATPLVSAAEENIVVANDSDESSTIPKDELATDDQQTTPEVITPEKIDELDESTIDPETENDQKDDAPQIVVPEQVIEEGNVKKEQQPQQYNKNHNKQQNQSNYRNQKNGKQNKGKFVINNGQ